MDKLQLYITRSYDGFSHMTDFNGNDSIKAHVTDITDAVKSISYNAEDKNIFYLLRSTNAGVFITIIRTIPTEPGDHLAAWLFIPSSASITSYDIEETINAIIEIISNSKITSDGLNTLQRILSKEYDTLQSPGQTVANSGTVYAHRMYGPNTGYSLTDLIGTKRYQTTYIQYAGVILADSSKASAVAGPDITAEPIEQMVRIFPPRANVSAYHPYIFGQPFNRPYLVPLMSTIEIVWKCPSEDDINQSIRVSQPNMRPEPIGKDRKEAAKPSTEPTPAPQTELITITPTINDVFSQPEKSDPAPAPAKPTPVKPFTVDNVTAAKAQEPTRPAAKPAEPVQKTATQHSRIYNFKLWSDLPTIKEAIELRITTDGIISESPIEGYRAVGEIRDGKDKTNMLKYEPKMDKAMMIKCAVLGLIAGIALTLLCVWALGGHSKSDKVSDTPVMADTVATDTETVEAVIADAGNTDTGTEVPKAETTQAQTAETAQSKSLQDAIKYLDSHDTWSKAEMESYPDLKGLYDDMNNFRHEKLYGAWATKLKGSKKYARVAKHSKLGRKKKPVIQNANGRTTLKAPSDKQEIYLQSFLNAIDH